MKKCELPVGKLIFEQASIEVDELFPQIINRRSAKEPYEIKRPVEKEKLSQLVAAFATSSGKLYFINDEKKVSELRSLPYRGLEREVLTPAKLKESIDLMRSGSRNRWPKVTRRPGRKLMPGELKTARAPIWKSTNFDAGLYDITGFF